MTVAVSIALPDLIVMTIDGAETSTFQDGHQEFKYDVAKSRQVPGVGCVTMWGARVGDRLLDKLRTCSNIGSIDQLQQVVWRYLSEEYKPDVHDLGETGYHVAGYDHLHHPRLWHITWSLDLPRKNSETHPSYKCIDHSYRDDNKIHILYNGKCELVQVVIRRIQQDPLGKLLYDPNRPVSRVQFCHAVARYVARGTPEVGPAFTTYLISPDNEIQVIRNRTGGILRITEIRQKLLALGVK